MTVALTKGSEMTLASVKEETETVTESTLSPRS